MKSIEQWSPLVTRVLGFNPGPMTLEGTNTYLLRAGKTRFLIDSGKGKEEYIGALTLAMKSLGVNSLEGVLITHHHNDLYYKQVDHL
jgi:glyoxylase-like metal-dependent hydrolase (beta-lactamase superfamily II)